MPNVSIAAGCAAALLALAAASPPACAMQRAFVASSGLDANPCSLTQPCRSFAAAIARTNAGGEIVVLDSAGYGSVVIDKSVSIVAPAGVYAGISVMSGDGIAIDGAGIVVSLRGLDVNGQGGANGVSIANADTVRIERCTISNMGGAGVYQAAGSLFVEDSTVRANAGIGVWSIGLVQASLHRVRLEGNLDGVRAQNGAEVAVGDSDMLRNAHVGAFAFANDGDASGRATKLDVAGSRITFNEDGVQARSIGTNSEASVEVTNTATGHNTIAGLLTSVQGGFADIHAQRTTIADDDLASTESIHVGSGTFVYLDRCDVRVVTVEDGGDLVTYQNNAVSVTSASGTFVTLPPL